MLRRLVSAAFRSKPAALTALRPASSHAWSPSLSPPDREQIFSTYPSPKGAPVREAWLESLDTTDSPPPEKLIRLHPAVWSVRPRIDIIKQNVDWQLDYKRVRGRGPKSCYRII